MNTNSVCSGCQTCQICQVKGVEGRASRNRNASGWPEIVPGLTTSEDIRSLAREIVEKSLAQSHAEVTQKSRRSHAGHEVKSADAWKWSIFKWELTLHIFSIFQL